MPKGVTVFTKPERLVIKTLDKVMKIAADLQQTVVELERREAKSSAKPAKAAKRKSRA